MPRMTPYRPPPAPKQEHGIPWRKLLLLRALRALPLMPRTWLGAIRTWFNIRLSRWRAGTSLMDDVNRLGAERDGFSLPVSLSASDDNASLPDIDLSIVTFDSAQWLPAFFASLLAQDYPLEKMHLIVVDHGSRDESLAIIEAFATQHESRFATITRLAQQNKGFGAGHNLAFQASHSIFFLVSNVDLAFERDAIRLAVECAHRDSPEVAAWECRQKPYEHPKYYDPVSGETPWCSHACCLLRRAAVQAVSGYDESIFMYGEDVELSYRLRTAGYHLRYLPRAVVQHHSQPGTVKPLQYLGGVYSNLLIRLRYGSFVNRLAAPAMALAHWLHTPPHGVRRGEVLAQLRKIPRSLWWSVFDFRKRRSFGIRFNRYAVERTGAWTPASELPATPQRVSIIVRTHAGREALLRQAIMSCVQQTWRNLEILIVEDGDSARSFADVAALDSRIRYESFPKRGRSATGNGGLAAARGEFLMLLDDDDLLFADHVEALMSAIGEQGGHCLAYSDALEAPIVRRDYRALSVSPFHTLTLIRCPRAEHAAAHIIHRNPFSIQSVLLSRSLFESFGGFDEKLEWLEDWDLWKRYFPASKIFAVAKGTSLYRTPANFRDVLRRQKKFALHFSRRG